MGWLLIVFVYLLGAAIVALALGLRGRLLILDILLGPALVFAALAGVLVWTLIESRARDRSNND